MDLVIERFIRKSFVAIKKFDWKTMNGFREHKFEPNVKFATVMITPKMSIKSLDLLGQAYLMIYFQLLCDMIYVTELFIDIMSEYVYHLRSGC